MTRTPAGAAVPAAVPAATVVVARVLPLEVGAERDSRSRGDGKSRGSADDTATRGGAFEVFLVKRHGKSGFMAGAHVFPGGRVDDDDASFDADRFAVAAIRETFEETGVLLARHESGLPMSSRAPKDAVVSRVVAGEPFAHALRAAGLVPDVESLAPIGWWITPEAEPKRFDTRFFFALVPPMQRHDAAPDGTEVTEGVWMTPQAALDGCANGTLALAPPTLVTLEELAPLTTSTVRAHPWPRRAIRPVISTDDNGGMVLALPGDPLHDVKEACWPHRTRVVLAAGGRFRSAVG